MTSDNWSEKRQFARACFDWPVTLISSKGSTIHGQVMDISRGGTLVHVDTKLKINEEVKLAIEIPDFDDAILAVGEVKRINRVLNLDKQKSLDTYEIGISFTEISAEDSRYFSGNLAPEWQDPVTWNEWPEKMDMPAQTNENVRSQNKSLKWGIGVICLAGLVLMAALFFQSLSKKPAVAVEKEVQKEDELRILSDRMSSEIESMRDSYQQQAVTISQIEKRLARMEESTISATKIDEIRTLLEDLTVELKQIKTNLTEQQAAISNISSPVPPAKAPQSIKQPSYHVVQKGETFYSISKQHGLTVANLLQFNNLRLGDIIRPDQKLQITPAPSSTQSN